MKQKKHSQHIQLKQKFQKKDILWIIENLKDEITKVEEQKDETLDEINDVVKELEDYINEIDKPIKKAKKADLSLFKK